MIRRSSITMNSRITNIVLPIIAVIVYIGIDLVYIFLAKNRYETVVKDIQGGAEMQVDLAAAFICYAVMALGWYFITVQLALSYYNRLKQRSPGWTPIASSALSGLVAGVLYGFVVYGVYNLTTRAIFNKYPVALLLQDMAWGTLFNMVYTSVYMIIWRKLSDPVDL